MSSGGPGGPPGPYGSPYGQPGAYGQPSWQQPRHTNSLAIAALCCGVAQFVAGPLAGIPAIVLGFIAVGQIQRTGEDGRAMAITGIVLGVVGTILAIVFIIIFVEFATHVSQLN